MYRRPNMSALDVLLNNPKQTLQNKVLYELNEVSRLD
jgi:hypothetical protein